jgi:GNAT superfamily N-acetyltransferase
MDLRPWEGPADTRAMQELGRRLWPRGDHPGGLGWEAASGQLPARVMMAVDGTAVDSTGVDGSIAGWAALYDSELYLQADPASQAARLLTEWAVGEAGTSEMTAPVLDGDETARSALTGAGFSAASDLGPVCGMFRAASPDRPVLPDGYRVRSVRPAELAARVEVHRRAWRPYTRPWPGEIPATITPDMTSKFTAESYERVRGTWPYDPAFDLVVEAADGTLAACCIAWWDPDLGCAEIEPLGVAPEHRRRGLATGMCLEVAARVAAAGGNQVYINVGPKPEYPAPAATYLAAGFDTVRRGSWYRRKP